MTPRSRVVSVGKYYCEKEKLEEWTKKSCIKKDGLVMCFSFKTNVN